MKIKDKHGNILSSTIMAADDDLDFGDDMMDDFGDGGAGPVEGDPDIEDNLDEMADNIDDMQDQLDEIEEDDVNIETENNIENHYIAECDRCHGIFISAMVESDQEVDHISGICPLCEKESDQFLYWVIRKAGE